MPQWGHVRSANEPAGLLFFSSKASKRWSARCRVWQEPHSVNGSLKVARWPEAFQTSGARITEESRPTTSSRPCTIDFHHWRFTLFFSSTPRGP